MRKFPLILIFFLSFVVVKGQQSVNSVTGKISLISSRNVYVRFASTSGISVGDTLFIPSGQKLVPALIVNNLSSTSCLCIPTGDNNLVTDHIIIARIKTEVTKEESQKVSRESGIVSESKVESDTLKGSGSKVNPRQKIGGSITLSSYSDFSSKSGTSSQRFRYTLSLDAMNIGESGFSFQTYISFRHKAGEWNEVSSNLFNALKIYNLSASYNHKDSFRVTLGRAINERIANIGPIDGLQVEKRIGKFSVGAIAGTRPDYENYGFDFSLFQYGGFIAFDIKPGKGLASTSAAFMQQTKSFKTDRRFLYIQHSNNLLKNLYFSGSAEIDLFKLENDTASNVFDLTAACLSVRYRISNRISVSATYDSRKNVMYYETFRSYIDRVLENERRQGIRLQASYRITGSLIAGVRGGYRSMKSDPKPSEHIGGYLTITKIPGINMSATLSGTWLTSSYLDGLTAGINFSGDYFNGKVQAGAGYNLNNFNFSEGGAQMLQHIGEMNLSLYLKRHFLLGVNYEITSEGDNLFNRLYAQVRFRF